MPSFPEQGSSPEQGEPLGSIHPVPSPLAQGHGKGAAMHFTSRKPFFPSKTSTFLLKEGKTRPAQGDRAHLYQTEIQFQSQPVRALTHLLVYDPGSLHLSPGNAFETSPYFTAEHLGAEGERRRRIQMGFVCNCL